jgi:enoyl-CoA hydratase/carnithine racemase
MIQSVNQSSQAAGNESLSLTVREGVAHLAMASPANRNALSLKMMGALADAFSAISRDPSVLCVVLSGEGPAFCAGHDLREITTARSAPDGGRTFYEETMARCSALMQQIAALPQPVIAAVEGVATAAGCQLVATCDLAVAGAAARFCTPGVDIGLFCSTPGVALGRAVAPKHAMEMLLTGEMIGAEDAHRFCLVNRIVPQGQALEAALAWAGQIATKSPQALRMGKATFRRQMACPLPQAYDLAARAMVENLLKADAREGIGAFLDKRAPTWQDLAP